MLVVALQLAAASRALRLSPGPHEYRRLASERWESLDEDHRIFIIVAGVGVLLVVILCCASCFCGKHRKKKWAAKIHAAAKPVELGEKKGPSSSSSSAPSNITICVIGLDGGGKTSILNSLQGKFGVKVRPTVGFGCVKMQLSKDTTVNFFDLGGTSKIRSNWANYYADVHGVLYVVDAADSARSAETKQLFAAACSHGCVAGKPILVLANKHDCKGARGADVMSTELVTRSMPNCKIQTCCAISLDSMAQQSLDSNIESGLEWLFKVKSCVQYQISYHISVKEIE